MFIETNRKMPNFSEKSGWVYIINTSGRKQYNKFCVSRMTVLETVRMYGNSVFLCGIHELIYHHNVSSVNILVCFSQGCDFWYHVSHSMQNFVETPVTLLAYFSQKMPELS